MEKIGGCVYKGFMDFGTVTYSSFLLLSFNAVEFGYK